MNVMFVTMILSAVLVSSLKSESVEKIKEMMVEKNIATREADFGFTLFREILKSEGHKNIFISPLSISMALSMTLNGASGETLDSMKRALRVEGLELDEINESYRQLIKSLQRPDSGVTIEIANALWGRLEIKYRHEFIVSDAKYYGAELKLINFNEAAPRLINKWVKAKTHGKISKIVDRIDPNTIVFLINAIYFKGAWKTTFDKKKTKEGEFTLLDGKKIKVPMMRQEGHFNYFKGPNYQAVSLPYGKEGKMSMYVFLPDESSNLDELFETLQNYGWRVPFEQFISEKGEIVLPRFKMDYGKELKDALASLGMGIAFDQMKADFTNLCFSKDRVYLQGVLHKSVIEVNEKGTEAAAVTSVRVGITALPKRFKMVVDRPFFFLIRDNESGVILFMGEVTNPLS